MLASERGNDRKRVRRDSSVAFRPKMVEELKNYYCTVRKITEGYQKRFSGSEVTQENTNCCVNNIIGGNCSSLR